jgi:CheY-like chemotaxis protein
MSLEGAPLLLVVDDEPDVLELASWFLKDAGFRIATAGHGREAVDALQGGLLPQAIVLDLMMPVMSGWEVWDWLQASPFAHVPVVIYTASGLGQGSIGKAPIVAKSSSPATLLGAIRGALAAAP